MSYSIRCPKHGCQFNPEIADCCPLCRQEADAAQQKAAEESAKQQEADVEFSPVEISDVAQRSGNPVWGILSVVAIAALLIGGYRLFDGGADVEGAGNAGNSIVRDEFTSKSVVVGSRLDPEAFRPELERLESDLYQGGSSLASIASRTAEGLYELSMRIQSRSRSIVANQAAASLRSFSQDMISRGGESLEPVDLPQVRRRWERFRNSNFVLAEWFHQSGPGHSSGSITQLPQIDSGLVDQLSRIAGEMVELISKGGAAAEEFGEPFADASQRYELSRLAREWDDWSRKWSAEVGRVINRMPPQPPSNIDVRLSDTHNKLRSALESLLAVPKSDNSSGVPFRRTRRNRFNQASVLVDESRQILSALQKP
jgi:hypothetical protein